MINVKASVVVLSLVSTISVCYSQSTEQGRMEEKISGAPEIEKGVSEYYMGLIGGVNSPIESGISSSAEGGINFAYQPSGSFGVGAEVTTSELKDVDRNQRTNIFAQTAYKIGGDTPVLQGTYLGVGAGPTIISTKVEWAVAPAIGVDIPLSKKAHDIVSLGLNAKYVGITNSPDSYVGSAVIKYWY